MGELLGATDVGGVTVNVECLERTMKDKWRESYKENTPSLVNREESTGR